ncbi:peptidylprolyl isomerase SurA [Catenovulum sp. 2E275]|uniref:peptidylprolyl isomerase SurA n=1 Tax=Catenovulum sp. 2E275 TaxID=2980497 RepID=UPI0021D0B240|nr:peptidylprolyl isomerase SurA [Catenovulum sp. 2E275]MCU4675089.1 peptidylprolyl isomerase SurA [Catenovulum sp. 2E275]
MKQIKKMITMLCASLIIITNAQAVELLDKVAVIVNQGVILENEIKTMTAELKVQASQSGQELPSDQALRVQVTERLITNELQQQFAQRIGLEISDAQVQQTVQEIAAKQNTSVENLRQQIINNGGDYESYLEQVRQELTASEVRRAMVSRRIYVSPQEIEGLVTLLKERGQKNEEYNLGHILIGLPSDATADEIENSKTRAEKVLALLKEEDSDFKKVAIGASSGARALDGGDLGWMNVNEMPTLFAEAVVDQKKDAIIGPIRSGAGFHILKIFDIRGRQSVEVKEVSARHILVKPSIIVSDEKAKNMLSKFLIDVKAGDADFAELAKEYSEDPGSAVKGGELGWADPSMYVPEFKNALAELEPGEYSKPFKTAHGWHIVQLLDRRTQDATESAYQDNAYRMLFNRKFNEEAEAWIREIRDQAYIEILGNNN